MLVAAALYCIYARFYEEQTYIQEESAS
jgi:hypothetical protein